MMKQNLSIEQSARLIELGVDENRASSYERCGKNENGQYRSLWWDAPNTTKGETSINDEDLSIVQRVFTLTDLLSILPKWIKHRHYLLYLEMGVDRYSEVWCASYRSEMGNDEADTFQSAEELIDCLYELLVFLIENEYYTPDSRP